MSILPLALLLLQGQERPEPTALVNQARALLPVFEGDRKELLTAAENRDVRAAERILDAALLLDPDQTFALWWSAHALRLLAADARTRGRLEEARERTEAALERLDRALTRDPGDAWALYARGMLLREAGDFDGAVEAFAGADSAAQDALARSGSSEAGAGDAAFVRFKARQWGADARMHAGDFEGAREAFRAFYADYGNNRWDLGYSLAETWLEERDFQAARAEYERLLEVEEYRAYASTYAQLGYLAGLTGDFQRGLQRLAEAVEREFEPTLYPRLWAWIVAEEAGLEDEAVAARSELADFVHHPPSGLSEWDRSLGAFVLGELDPARFGERVQAELQRRLAEALPLDDLPCEVAVYRGIRLEREGREAGEPDRVEALRCWVRALEARPETFKWEWAWARRALARWAAGAPLPLRPLPDPSGSPAELRLHRYPALVPRPLETGELERLVAGDLLVGRTSDAGGPWALPRVVLPDLSKGR